MSMTGDGMSMTDGKITVSKENAGDGTFTVTVQGNQYVYNVVNVGIQSLTITSIGGKTPTDYTGEGYNYTAVYQLRYTSSSSFSVVTAVTPENSYVDVDKAVTMSSNTYVAYSNGNLSVKSGVTNQRTEVTFSCGGKTALCALNLIDSTNSPFTKSDIITTAEGYGITNYYVGTNGAAITLGHLFAYNNGVEYADIDDQVITYSFSQNGWTSQSFAAGENWQSHTVDLSKATANMDLTVKLSVGGKGAEVTVKLIKGAYNVTNADEWKAVPDSTSIILLNDFTMPNITATAFSTGPSSTSYSKNIGSAKIYGNLHKISFGTYLIKIKGNNYFLRMGNSSSLNDLIIDGPAYGTRQATTNTNGYFVSGIETTSTSTINNCYISGFRTPIYAQGTTMINNSVINGGAFANIYIHSSISITLNNVETYQGVHGSAEIGGGIFIDNNSSTATNATITATNLKQYNFYTENQIKEIANSLSFGAGSVIDFDEFSALLSDGYYHAGIITWNEKSNLSSKFNSGNGVNGYAGGSYTKNFWIAYRDVAIYGRGPNCPTDSKTGSVSEFLTDPIRKSN